MVQYYISIAIGLFLQSTIVAAIRPAQACFNLGYGPHGTCNSDPMSSEFLETFLLQDRLFSNCSSGGIFNAIAKFVDLNGVTSTVSAISTVSISNSYSGPLLFRYNVPLSTIGTIEPVQITITATNANPVGTLSSIISYTQLHSPTIVFDSAISNVTRTYAVTTVSTFTFTATATTTVTPLSRTTVTKTGYTTTLAPRPTTTVTYTLTPSVRTIVNVTIVPTRTTLTCVAALKPSISKRQAAVTAFAVPYCSAPTTTTVISTTTSVFNATSLYTKTSLTTITSFFSELASSPTVFVRPTSTSTLTPRMKTLRVATIIDRPTIYITSTITSTSTIYARGAKSSICGQRTPSIDFSGTSFRISNTLSSSTSSSNTLSSYTSISTSSRDLVAQAASVISGNNLQPFCSTFLGYEASTSTIKTTSTRTYSSTSTIFSGTSIVAIDSTQTQTTIVPSTTITITATPVVKTVSVTSTALIAVTHTYAAKKKRSDFTAAAHNHHDHNRRSAQSIPSPLTDYPTSILSSACSLKVTPASSVENVTSTVFVTTTTAILTTNLQATATSVRTIITTTTVLSGGLTTNLSPLTTTSTLSFTATSTTTISIASSAPTGSVTYLQFSPSINGGASFALSDPATHMTDNYYSLNSREVFIVTAAGALYSVSHNAYYLTSTTDSKLYWSNSEAQATKVFYTQAVAASSSRQLFMRNGPTSVYSFCLMTAASGDGNSATGLHVYYFPSAAQFPSSCQNVSLLMVPV